MVLLFFMPMLTMRLFAEEKKSGTIELLLTYPVRDGEVLAGKYAAALALYLILLGLILAAVVGSVLRADVDRRRFRQATADENIVEFGAVIVGEKHIVMDERRAFGARPHRQRQRRLATSRRRTPGRRLGRSRRRKLRQADAFSDAEREVLKRWSRLSVDSGQLSVVGC